MAFVSFSFLGSPVFTQTNLIPRLMDGEKEADILLRSWTFWLIGLLFVFGLRVDHVP